VCLACSIATACSLSLLPFSQHPIFKHCLFVSVFKSIIGILFPPDEDRPRLIQLDCRARIDISTGGPLAWQPLVQNVISDEHPSQVVLEQGVSSMSSFARFGAGLKHHSQIAGDNLRFPIQLWSRATFLNDGSPINRSIYRLTKGQARYPWRGPFIALKFRQVLSVLCAVQRPDTRRIVYSGTRRQGYVDMSLNDLPALVSHFLQVKGA
jgi:hypothetical protein